MLQIYNVMISCLIEDTSVKKLKIMTHLFNMAVYRVRL